MPRMLVDALLRRLRDDVTGGWAAAEAAAGAGPAGLAPRAMSWPGVLRTMDLCT
eukprot:COSAG06_NODE_17516_length_937_cov_0.781623_1_plen_53_part_10